MFVSKDREHLSQLRAWTLLGMTVNGYFGGDVANSLTDALANRMKRSKNPRRRAAWKSRNCRRSPVDKEGGASAASRSVDLLFSYVRSLPHFRTSYDSKFYALSF